MFDLIQAGIWSTCVPYLLLDGELQVSSPCSLATLQRIPRWLRQFCSSNIHICAGFTLVPFSTVAMELLCSLISSTSFSSTQQACQFSIIIIIASHPCQGIGHRQTSSTHPSLELSCLEPPTSCQHLSFLFPCIFSMSPVAYPCLSSPADSTEDNLIYTGNYKNIYIISFCKVTN